MFVCVSMCGLLCLLPKGGFHFATLMSHLRCLDCYKAGSQIFTVISERFIFYPKSRQAGTDPFLCQSS